MAERMLPHRSGSGESSDHSVQYRADNNAGSKKSRATSCTGCRQVKLKCDLKARYPSPCSRCSTNRLDCRTDVNFKRIPARSRIKDLENQVDQLRRARNLEQLIPNATVGHANEVRADSLSSTQVPTSSAGSRQHSIISPVGSPTASGSWLRVTDVDPESSFALGDFTMTGNDVLELFQQFELLYYPHFCILEPVDSLVRLHQDSSLLFWTIALVAARHHTTLHAYLPALQQAHTNLYAKVFLEAIQSLHDIQAVLMICTWPGPVKQQPHDPSWQQLGLVINAARQMGLHKASDWFIVGSKPFKRQLSEHSLSTRKMTWLKAFELDVQMSLWHGHTPTLSLPQHVQTVTEFCADPTIPRRYVACVEIYVQAARYLDAATDGMACDLSSALVRQYDKALDAVKQRYADAWTVDAELMFLAAKLYLAGMRLSNFNKSAFDGTPEHQDVDSNEAFCFEALQAAYSIAVRMATLVTDLSNEIMHSDSSSKHLKKTHSMPGYPKSPVRFLFFAAIVLLKYIDSAGKEHTAESENARNAFSAIYQMFKQCENSLEHQRAAKNLEIAGRAIGNGQTHIECLITARMSASLMFNVMWTARKVVGKREDLFPPTTEIGPASVCEHDRQQSQICQAQNPAENHKMTPSSLPAQKLPDQPPQAWATPAYENVIQNTGFPFGVWDGAVYDNFVSNTTLESIPLDWNMDFTMLDGIGTGEFFGGTSGS